MRDANLHKGHRQRLKDKIRQFGFKGLSDHEILEFWLYQSIPLKDTNEIAHRLLNSYGSIYNVFNADPLDLMIINGVGKETALFLSCFPKMREVYDRSKYGTSTVISGPISAVKYFRENFEITNKECCYLCFTDKNSNLINFSKICEGSAFEINLDIDDLSKKFRQIKAKNVMFIHTHPSSSPNPSEEDIRATRLLMIACKMAGFHFNDHVIISASEYYSFRDNHLLDELNIEVADQVENFKAGGSKK